MHGGERGVQIKRGGRITVEALAHLLARPSLASLVMEAREQLLPPPFATRLVSLLGLIQTSHIT